MTDVVVPGLQPGHRAASERKPERDTTDTTARIDSQVDSEPQERRSTLGLAVEAGRLVCEAAGANPADRHVLAVELGEIGRRLARCAAALNLTAMEDARWLLGAEEGARWLDLTANYVRRKTADLEQRRPRANDTRRAVAVELYRSGWPAYRVARHLKANDGSVLRWAREAGVPIRGEHRRG